MAPARVARPHDEPDQLSPLLVPRGLGLDPDRPRRPGSGARLAANFATGTGPAGDTTLHAADCPADRAALLAADDPFDTPLGTAESNPSIHAANRDAAVDATRPFDSTVGDRTEVGTALDASHRPYPDELLEDPRDLVQTALETLDPLDEALLEAVCAGLLSDGGALVNGDGPDG